MTVYVADPRKIYRYRADICLRAEDPDEALVMLAGYLYELAESGEGDPHTFDTGWMELKKLQRDA